MKENAKKHQLLYVDRQTVQESVLHEKKFQKLLETPNFQLEN